ncbi:Hypothetical_protein [Hexamita inflata]|uniref:Hypothetical_protein n=1 Tax=Hexamita inflata TaxID=28002 RepID=A0AA86VSA4_9EUKA|nr:Hypothetical protein HINF_LOCUS63258 [Hexamita inflata]
MSFFSQIVNVSNNITIKGKQKSKILRRQSSSKAQSDVEIQLILHSYIKSLLQLVRVDIFSPTLINIWSEKLQIKIKSVYVKVQKSQLQLSSLYERLLKNRGASSCQVNLNQRLKITGSNKLFILPSTIYETLYL